MSTEKLQNLRSFLTERFTAVAVEIFEEFETIVGEYCAENKRLRNVLHMVLEPEMKLPRIDDSHHTGATADVREPPSELITEVHQEISEQLNKIPKEEETECDINWGSEQQLKLEEADHLMSPDCVKSDPEDEDTSMPCITDSFHIKVVDVNPGSSGTLTADEDVNCSASDSDAAPDFPQLSRSKESASQSREPQKRGVKSRKSLMKPKWSLQKTVLEIQRTVPKQPLVPVSTDCKSFLARLTEAFKDFPDDKKPLITKMGLTENVELVDSAFGKVPKGCPLSYQCPMPSGRDYTTYDDAPPRPPLPLDHHRLKPKSTLPTLSAKEQEQIDVMQITWEAARTLEHSTRGQKLAAEELRNLRLTSRFREICKLKPGRSNAEHLIFKIQKGLPKCKTTQIEEETKAEALRDYCKQLCVNWSPCGLVIHPNAPWLGALPDGLVYDPKETTSFGLVHVKCIGFRRFIECKFLFYRHGVLQLMRNHSHYWHIQGEMMVTGTDWCDLLVYSTEDILVQRIYRDAAMIKAMKEKLEDFFFYYYLPCLF